jgi:hypothetical protein
MIPSDPSSTTATSGRPDSAALTERVIESLDGCAWAIEKDGNLVGRIDVLHDGPRLARIRLLSIDPAWYRSSAVSRLVEMARRYCLEHGPRRLLAEAGSAPGWMLAMLRRRGVPVVRPKPLVELIPSQPRAVWSPSLPQSDEPLTCVEDCLPAGHPG